MVQEVLEGLALKPGAVVVDGTLGLAGHSLRMISQISPGGTLVGIDWDEKMLDIARKRLEQVQGVDLALFRTDYRAVYECLKSASLRGADAILLDLGLNNAQIEDDLRGISFRKEGPLDMRMDQSKNQSAADFLNTSPVREIERVLLEYGDERWAKRIAEVIVDRRKQQPLESTGDLVDCVLAAVPAAKRDKRIHPATRTFQAVRIHINGELEGLQDAIEGAGLCLNANGRMAVLSYHSGEDRAVKRAFKALAETDEFRLITKRPLVPGTQEQRDNPKSRSAKLRLIERLSRKEGTS
jgi:16S rRNA (cytosine1402-N4)-methyltransferase